MAAGPKSHQRARASGGGGERSAQVAEGPYYLQNSIRYSSVRPVPVADHGSSVGRTVPQGVWPRRRRERGRSNGGSPMATSFYELSVPTFLQTVRAVGGFLDRTVRHC